jgi:hypothetical protein
LLSGLSVFSIFSVLRALGWLDILERLVTTSIVARIVTVSAVGLSVVSRIGLAIDDSLNIVSRTNALIIHPATGSASDTHDDSRFGVRMRLGANSSPV